MDDDTRIEIFRPGTFTSLEGAVVTFGDADLRAIAAAYDTEANPAPLVIGHPALEDPAWGWVDRLEMDGDRLVAVPRDVEPAFAELVRDKRYARVSARFYPKGAANSPNPAGPYLKHVGFLGAAAPAVKGLRPISFAAADLAGTLTIDLPDQPKEPSVAEQQQDQSFAELTTQVATLKQQLADSVAATAAAAKVARHDAALSFADAQVAAGKLAPAGKALVVGLLDQLDGITAISFGEGDANQLTPAAAFRKLFEGAQPVVSFGELAGRRTAPGADGDAGADTLAHEAISFADDEVKAGRPRPSSSDAVYHVKQRRAAAAAAQS